MRAGTISYEDIYGAGSTDLQANVGGETQQLTNPNNPAITGKTVPGESTIFHISGSFLGQPLMIWIALLGLLVVVKLVMEKE